MQASKTRPSAPAVVKWSAVAVLFGSGLALVLEIGYRANLWAVIATTVWVLFMFPFAHFCREIHLDGRLPRIGDWRNHPQYQQVSDDDWEAAE